MTEHEKFILGGLQWGEQAARILAEVVREQGEEGVTFSFCQVFVDAPAEIADMDGSVCRCYYIDGKTVRSHAGRSKDVDIYMQATWALVLPRARHVHTTEWIAEQEKNPTPQPEDANWVVEGDMAKFPAWITDFHNRLAPWTA